jgi:enamine deaminase RidA (YjgF/YER057c/UK114 family)
MTTQQVESFGVSWEEAYGYVQAVRHGDTIYVSGQLSHDGEHMVAPAPLDEDGRITYFGDMADQMAQTYANAKTLLARFGASLDDVVEEVIYVLDVDAGMAAAGPVRKAAYGTDRPQVASTIIGVTRLALPPQLLEIKLIARV